jgi:methylglutaconyl-CoA hydratase
VHLVILGSDGPHFCAGGDLRWMQEQMKAGRATKMAEASKLSAMLTALDKMPKPVIGRVQGNAYGGGLGLICACDIAVGIEGVSFALTESRLGLIPATIGPMVFRKLGWGHTRQIFMTGSKINHRRALQLGLLSLAVPADILNVTIEEEISHALKAGPKAMAAAKALLRGFSQQNDWQEQNDLAITALADCWETQETQEGISAFFNKCPAPWIKD